MTTKRQGLLLLALIVGAILLPQTAFGQRPLKFDEPLKGELTEQHKTAVQFAYRPDAKQFKKIGIVYKVTVPVQIKAGQSLTVSANVVGKGRYVGLQLFDPARKRIGDQFPLALKKGITETFEELGATGVYKLVLFSDQIGAFTITAKDPAGKAEPSANNAATLEQQLLRVNQQVAEIEAELSKLKRQAAEIREELRKRKSATDPGDR